MLSVAPYYKVRNICHALKNNNPKAIQISANLFSKYVSQNDTIVPMPSHNGNATYMLQIANLIAKQTGCQISDTLSSTPHEPWYDTKLKNGINADIDYNFNVIHKSKPNIQGTIYVIDNVCSTGKTMKAAVDKVQREYPKNNVEGLVLGLVDDETIKRLHYGPNLHESQINSIVEGVINNYLKKNIL